MSLTSLQVCMDSSEWLQGTIDEECGMDSSSPSGDMLTCSRPLIERRLRVPQHHDQALIKCPRCDSTHTKFCYYNNYSLSQPRYFCKTCRRYWTKGGTLRNIPVGGGCRKNKKVSTKKSSSDQSANNNNNNPGSSSHNPTDLHLSFPEMQLSHLNNILGTHGTNTNFMESKYNSLLENPRPIDFIESRLEAMVGSPRNYDFMGNGELGLVGDMSHGLAPNLHGLCSPYGMSLDGNGGTFMDTCQRIMLPYDANEDQHAMDVKPNTKLLSLDWQDQGCSDAGKDTYGYLNNLGPWTGNGMMNNYGMEPPRQIH